MMTTPDRPRRRRGRRSGRRAPQDQTQPSVVEATRDAPAEAAPPDRDTGGDRPQPEVRARGGSPEPQGGGRKRGRGRRRNNRRQTIGPMPTEVLKDSAPVAPAQEPLAARSLDACTVPTGMTFGCPMLTRTRIGMPYAGGRHAARCAMGWSIHGESEALLCMRTPDMLDCWKTHPEKEAELRATDESEHAAD